MACMFGAEKFEGLTSAQTAQCDPGYRGVSTFYMKYFYFLEVFSQFSNEETL